MTTGKTENLYNVSQKNYGGGNYVTTTLLLIQIGVNS